MKTLLGIDYGLRKTGVALSSGSLATPYEVIRTQKEGVLIAKISKIVRKENVEKIILGVSEGDMAEKTRSFGEKMNQEIQVPIEFYDETLTTYEAQRLAIESGMKRSRRRRNEDSMAAALTLQSYLDNK